VASAVLTRRKASKIPSFARAAAIVALLVSACAAPKTERNFATGAADAKHVFLVHNEWHAAIVARRADIAVDEIPELVHFSGAHYIEISWGDADFFPAAEAGIGLALKAAFWSRGSVLHLVGFNGTVKETYGGAEVFEIALSEQEFRRLIGFVAAEFQRQQPSREATPSPGLFPGSRFFPAKSNFSVLKTCNTWVAEAFSAAGLPVRPGYVFTAGNLAAQMKDFAAVE
jgi:uncharacterized protein (TIGR02117 family)